MFCGCVSVLLKLKKKHIFYIFIYVLICIYLSKLIHLRNQIKQGETFKSQAFTYRCRYFYLQLSKSSLSLVERTSNI